MPVSKRLRFEVLRRDDYTCRYCGGKAPDVAITIDHVVPVALGGTDQADNLVAACNDCNAGKSSSSPDGTLIDDVAADAMRWSRAMQRATEDDRKQRSSDVQFFNRFVDLMIELYRSNTNWYELPIPDPDQNRSILKFRDCGLDLDDLYFAIQKAMSRRLPEDEVWRYFCGICWRMITDRQEAARASLTVEENS